MLQTIVPGENYGGLRMKKKMKNVVFTMLSMICILVSNLMLMPTYAAEAGTTENDVRRFYFDVTYEGTRIEGTTIEVFDMDFDSTGTNDEKYKLLAQGTTVVACDVDLTYLEQENNILYVRYTLPSPYEFRYVETDENGEATDIPSDYELYWLADLETYADGETISFVDVIIGTTPETPTTPDAPSTPDVPSTPETPSTPEIPSTPETPSTSGVGTTSQVNEVSSLLNSDSVEKVVYSDATSATQVEAAVLSDIFQTMKNTGKDTTFSFEDENGNEAYSWTFNGTDITNPQAHISDFKVETNAKVEEVDQAIAATGVESTYETVHFSHEGELPGTATVKARVNLPDQKVYFYYYNPVTRFLELVSDNVMIQNGYATFQIEHCSDYVLSSKALIAPTTINPATTDKTQTTENETTSESQEAVSNTASAPKTADVMADTYFIFISIIVAIVILFVMLEKARKETES